jgi:hypothetical protein
LEGIGGRYFEDGNEAEILQGKPEMFGGGVSPYALDPTNAEKLWKMATELMKPLQN